MDHPLSLSKRANEEIRILSIAKQQGRNRAELGQQ